MKEELKNIMLMGLGAMSLTTDKAKEIKNELLEKGTKIYEEGKVANEELKHNIEEKITVVVENKEVTTEEVKEAIQKMSKEEKNEIMKLLKETKSKKDE